MADVAELEIRVRDEGTQQAQGNLTRLESAFGGAQAAVITFNQALQVAQAVLGALDRALGSSIRAAADQERALAALNAQLQIQGRYSAQYSQALQDQAAALQRVTTYADETINSAQAMLATFPKLGNDVLPRATQAALDLASALGTDLQGAAQTIGIALNDPAEGLARLSRLGVRFTDDQKAVVQSLVDTGNAAQAQTYILDELASRMGGRAQAAAQTFDGSLTRLTNAFGDLLEEVGNVVVKNEAVRAGFEQLQSAIEGATAATKEYVDETEAQREQDTAGWITLVSSAYAGLKDALIDTNPLLQENIGFFNALGNAIGAIGSQFKALKEGGGFLDDLREFAGRIDEANAPALARRDRTTDLDAAGRAYRDFFNSLLGRRARRPGDTFAGPPEEFAPGEFSSAAPDASSSSAFGGPFSLPADAPSPYAGIQRGGGATNAYDYYQEAVGPFAPGDPNFVPFVPSGGRGGRSQSPAVAFAQAGATEAQAQADAAEQTLRLLQEQLATEEQQLEAARALDAARQGEIDAQIKILQAKQQSADLTAGERAEIQAQIDALSQQRDFLAQSGGEAAKITREFERQHELIGDQALQLRESVRPLEAIGAQIARINELAAQRPDILTPDVVRDLTAKAERDGLGTQDTFDDLINATRQFGQDFTRTLAEALSPDGARVSFRQFLSSLVTDVNEFVLQKTLTDPLLDFVDEQVIQPIKGKAGDRSLLGFLGDLGGGAFDALLGGGSDRPPTQVIPGIGEVDTAALDALNASAGQAGDTLLAAAQKTDAGFAGIIGDIGNGFLDLFSGLGDTLGSLFSSLFGENGFDVAGFFGSLVGGAAKGAVAHEGALILHAGGFGAMRPGEVPAILEAGELVLSKSLTRDLLDTAKRGPARRYHDGGLVDRDGPMPLAPLAELTAPRRDRGVSGAGVGGRGGDTYNIHVTQHAQSLDPRTTAQLLQQQSGTIVGIIRRDIARGGGLSTDVGQRGS